MSASRILPVLYLLLLPVAGAVPPSMAQSADAQTADSPDPLIVVSIDGLRWDYLDLHEAPTLSRLAEDGAHVEHLTPVFPTKTFPNHYSTVTGLYPSNHGIIANTMYDPAMDASFSLGDRDAVENPDWWGGEPIWVTAEQQGRTAATYFWPGSEAPVQGTRPTEWFEYDGSVPGPTRVDQALQWLDRPADTRPDLITLYFSRVDTKGHYHGPRSDSVATALREVDGFIRRLLDGLDARGMEDDVNLIVTSDHGMSPTARDRTVVLDDYIDPDDVRLTARNPVAMMEPRPNVSADSVVTALDRAPHLSAYRKGTLPDTLHFDGHRRIPSVVAVADDRWSIRTQAWMDENPDWTGGGTHGYDPRHESMHTLLLAHGPAFLSSTTIDQLSLIHLYELMAALLDVEPAPNDGRLEAARPLLTPAAARAAE
ncbi:ectonucleotide pyrophosphatase/phosphodiesterase [Salinibacter sp.]|uniref:alkaline phosphatase family protein n=1 Tax=Salinibacter sp. TaxID=2065818 RepID=UPI0021E78A93|nr:ectonucleotide pyrophosphatase/phosphodiesterase [Salinibacter sp.]